MQTYCSPHGHTDSKQGYLPADFWKEGQVALKSGTGKNGKRYTQLTGCINSSKLDRLIPSDAGGQYDSSGGYMGQGNPQGSTTTTLSSSSREARERVSGAVMIQ
ncbi:hypothetical protein CPB85DRAFT_401766 [Mucidula mucida]|nr:hypothetical protein CPB85DRAFT_401766 [Mucidula mucida]